MEMPLESLDQRFDLQKKDVHVAFADGCKDLRHKHLSLLNALLILKSLLQVA